MSLPFRAIHYFVEVGRCQSFSNAAERLHVSQSAVSHQVALLEESLGAKLFVRRGRQVMLSAVGESYFNEVAGAISTIEQATTNFNRDDSRKVRLAVHGSLAVKWLIPALNEFRQRYPNIDLTLQMLTRDGDFDTQWADCFITTQPPATGYQRFHLYDETLKPYCSKELWSEVHQLKTADELIKYPLLSAISAFASGKPGTDWQRWFKQVNIQLPAKAKIHHFSHLLLAAEAAKYGQGIALLNEFMTTEQERAESLFELPFHGIKTEDSFYFVYPSTTAQSPGLEALASWLVKLCRARSSDKGPP
ncbi:LysR substrate-binding domain-containing protein [Idiomarina seosinensis]|uniref:LysR family transcriptional regulator n=1 Tax=Idiomarina seosinensis TaxID=281739 RepID=A0A432ZHM7_9GAMM|nr:LysR substrate-binding domain-containing protein [Idiomarina seosinensis]RUO77527.1 LysR family transcriptional regulator [Idiomarina seosinensis]